MIKNNQGFSLLLILILLGLTSLSLISVFRFLEYQTEASQLNNLRAFKSEIQQKLEYLMADQSQCRTQFVDLTMPNTGQFIEVELDYPDLNEKLKANAKLDNYIVDKIELENTETLSESDQESFLNTHIKVFLSSEATERHEIAPIYVSKILKIDTNTDAITDCVGSKDVASFCRAFTKKYDPESNPRCRDLTEEELQALGQTSGSSSGGTSSGDSSNQGGSSTDKSIELEYASCNPMNSIMPAGINGQGLYVFGMRRKDTGETHFALRSIRNKAPCDQTLWDSFISSTSPICNFDEIGSSYHVYSAEETANGFKVYNQTNGASCEAFWQDTFNPTPMSSAAGKLFNSTTTSITQSDYKEYKVLGGYRILNRDTCEMYTDNSFSDWIINKYDSVGTRRDVSQMKETCRTDCIQQASDNGFASFNCYYMGTRVGP
ncbi:MAG: hypothetical protein KDD58_00105 [Bdellovibrionales bacterium]|nr:hypothetical protein [Bdellovibrionales bacterium]